MTVAVGVHVPIQVGILIDGTVTVIVCSVTAVVARESRVACCTTQAIAARVCAGKIRTVSVVCDKSCRLSASELCA
jgi:hypothetical protein